MAHAMHKRRTAPRTRLRYGTCCYCCPEIKRANSVTACHTVTCSPLMTNALPCTRCMSNIVPYRDFTVNVESNILPANRVVCGVRHPPKSKLTACRPTATSVNSQIRYEHSNPFSKYRLVTSYSDYGDFESQRMPRAKVVKMPTMVQSIQPVMVKDMDECSRRVAEIETRALCPVRPAQGECLVVIQYRNAGDQRIRNALTRASARLRQYNGYVIGIADQVSVVEAPEGSPWLMRDDWCIALLLFPSQFMARRWYESDKEWKQYDFLTPPAGVQMFSVPLRFIPNWNEKRTFLWMEFEGVLDKAGFQAAYVNPMTQLLDSYGVDHGLVFLNDADSMKVDRLKDCWIKPGNHICLSILNSEEDYEKLRNSEEYQKIVYRIHSMCLATSLLFTIDPNIST